MRLASRHDELASESDARKQYLMEMGDKLCKHWDLLSVGEEEQAAFEASLTAPPGGISLATIRKGEAELKRLEDLKAAKVCVFYIFLYLFVEVDRGGGADEGRDWGQTFSSFLLAMN